MPTAVKRVPQVEGQPRRQVSGSFVFSLVEGDMRHGDFVFQLSLDDGSSFEIDCTKIYNIYDTFNSIARDDPENLAVHIAKVNASAEASSRTYQKAYDEHLREKYPGWPHAGRKKTEAIAVATDKLNVEDLDL